MSERAPSFNLDERTSDRLAESLDRFLYRLGAAMLLSFILLGFVFGLYQV